ncbi:MAG: proline--tRNA ligase, partial [Synergistaceae bacterium]|nr:proline--tRNA ligase [Synergistaceae bacterium]
GELEYCWTTSWGISTRLIGALIMTHSDDDGLILPPKIAPVKAAIVPISQDDKFIDEVLLPKAKEIAGIVDNLYGFNHVVIDKDFHMRPGDRFFTHLQKGVPLRIELGEKDIKAGTARLVRRDTGEKIDASLNDLEAVISRVLDEEQANLYNKAKNFRISNTHFAKNYDEFKDIIANQGGFVEAYFAGTPEDEVKIREDTGATPRCIVTGDDRTGPCMITGKTGRMTIFAKAY